ncbi:hypothetical protein ACYEXS_29875 [Paenibacillus sp. MAH-36]|uniref:Uncharacterized protein n=1 Tax=Paenibacillus violae TaxID=3077234 RepID=A0ABU3RQF4_9BACL|nr:hypothetical protein [Paenibacillus sp. PFR10]MDU0206403.1 hypothetical protein [Paenibacillus sp. PFR10]
MILFTLGMIWLSQANTSSILFMAAGIIGIGYGATLISFQTMPIQSSPIAEEWLQYVLYAL